MVPVFVDLLTGLVDNQYITLLTYTSETISSIAVQRLYPGTITGDAPAVGATLLQAGTNATGTVVAIDVVEDSLDITTVGSPNPFDASGLVTGTNPDASEFTFTPPVREQLDVWQLTGTPVSISCAGSDVAPLVMVRQLETASAESHAEITIEYAGPSIT
jgi:hypothetical protein